MVGSRTATALAGVAISVALSAAIWYVFGTALFFLFVPIVPFLFRRGRTGVKGGRRCPTCDFRTTDRSYEYCPRDGTRLD